MSGAVESTTEVGAWHHSRMRTRPPDFRGTAVSALWTSEEIAAAIGGTAQGDFEASGVAFDSREVEPGHLFVAMKGEATDGHLLPRQGLRRRRRRARSSARRSPSPTSGSPTPTAALNALGRAARDRTSARICGVTGSAGKTGTKEALYAALDRAAPRRGAPLGEELQQPCRRAALARPDAARDPLRRVRDGDEPCRRAGRADPAGPARTSPSSPPSPRPTAPSSPARRRSPTPRARSSRGWRRAASPSFPTTAPIATGSPPRPGPMPAKVLSFGARRRRRHPRPRRRALAGRRLAGHRRSCPRPSSPSPSPSRATIGCRTRSPCSARSRRWAATWRRRGWRSPTCPGSRAAASGTGSASTAARRF